MSTSLLSAIAEKFLSDLLNFISKRRKPLIIAGGVVVVVLIGLVVKGWFKPKGIDPNKLGLGPLVQTDDNGDKWQLDLVTGQPLDTIAASGADPGPPLIVMPEVKLMGRFASIGVVVLGRAGEKYVAGVRKNDEWQAPPSLKIVDVSGRIMGAYKLEYG